jgi:hypothetical protein
MLFVGAARQTLVAVPTSEVRNPIRPLAFQRGLAGPAQIRSINGVSRKPTRSRITSAVFVRWTPRMLRMWPATR